MKQSKMSWRKWIPPVFYERLSNGSNWYTLNPNRTAWGDFSNKLETASTHPILIPVFDVLSKYFANARFYIQKGEKEVDSHWLLDLLKKPNYYQTQDDFLTQHIIYKYAFGWKYLYPVHPVGFPNKVSQLHNLNSGLIEFQDNLKTGILDKTAVNKGFVYNKEIDNLNLKFGDIIPFFDQPNGYSDNLFVSHSRIEGVKKQLGNTAKAFDAKNIILQTNGKEMLSTKSSGGNGFGGMLSKSEKEEVEKRQMENYGLATGRNRTLVSKADLRWQSMHIPLRELGLDESVIKDAQIIVSAFDVPKDLVSISEQKADYENQERAEIGFLQGTVRKNLNDFCNTLSSRFLKGEKLMASIDHFEIMKSVKMKEVRNKKAEAETFKTFVDAGVVPQSAAKHLGLDLKFVKNGQTED